MNGFSYDKDFNMRAVVGSLIMTRNYQYFCFKNNFNDMASSYLLNDIYMSLFKKGEGYLRRSYLMEQLFSRVTSKKSVKLDKKIASFVELGFLEVGSDRDWNLKHNEVRVHFKLKGGLRECWKSDKKVYGDIHYMLNIIGQCGDVHLPRGIGGDSNRLDSYNLRDCGLQRFTDARGFISNDYDRENFLCGEGFEEGILLKGLRGLGISEEDLEGTKIEPLEVVMAKKKAEIGGLVKARKLGSMAKLSDLRNVYNIGRKDRNKSELGLAGYKEGQLLRVYSMDSGGIYPNEYLSSYELRSESELYFKSEEVRVRKYIMGSATGISVEEVSGEMPILLEGLLCHLGIDMSMWEGLRERGNIMGLEIDDMTGMEIYYKDMSDDEYDLEMLKVVKDRRNMIALCEIIQQYLSKNIIENVFIGKFNQALSRNYLANISKMESETVKNNRSRHQRQLELAREKHKLELRRLELAQSLIKDNGGDVAPPQIIIQGGSVDISGGGNIDSNGNSRGVIDIPTIPSLPVDNIDEDNKDNKEEK